MSPDPERAPAKGERTLGERIVQKLSYLVAVVFVLAGLGVISGVLFKGDGLGRYRVVFGIVILIYGLARLGMVRRKERRGEQADRPTARDPL
jgi:hypothetical protein